MGLKTKIIGNKGKEYTVNLIYLIKGKIEVLSPIIINGLF